MSKYVVIADLHTMVGGHSLTINGIPEKIYFPLENLRNACNLAKEENADVIIAGDLIENSDKVPQIVLDHLYDTLQECKQILDPDNQIYIVCGNHDYTNYNNKQYTFLKYLDFEVAFSGNPIFIGDTVLIGHNYNRDKIIEDFQKIDIQSTKLIVSHFGLQEAKVGNTSYIGGEFSIRDFIQMEDSLLILGHYHKPQKVAKNIYYVGSPIPVRVDERDDEKRIILVDTETLEIQSIPTTYPKFITKKLSHTDEVDFNILEKDIQDTFSKYVFILPSDHPQYSEIKKFSNKLKGYAYIYEEIPQEQLVQDIEDIVNVKHDITIESISDEFLEKSHIPKEKFEEYKNIAKQFWS